MGQRYRGGCHIRWCLSTARTVRAFSRVVNTVPAVDTETCTRTATSASSAMGRKGVNYNSYYLPNLDAGIAGFDPRQQKRIHLDPTVKLEWAGPYRWGLELGHCLKLWVMVELFSPNVGWNAFRPVRPCYFSCISFCRHPLQRRNCRHIRQHHAGFDAQYPLAVE